MQGKCADLVAAAAQQKGHLHGGGMVLLSKNDHLAFNGISLI